MDLLVRKATHDDLERIVEIHFSSFPDDRGYAERRRHFEHNPLGGLSDLYIVEHRGRPVGHGFLHALRAWFGGREVAIAGIESLGVAPEARGLGIGAHLLERMHADSQARGDALSLLYVFRQGFYARHGYAPVMPMMKLDVRPSSIPAAWVSAARGMLRPLLGDDRPHLEALYARIATERTGWITRPPNYWESRLLEPRTKWFVTEDGRGYVAWSLEQRELHAPITLVVWELCAEDAATERMLWGHLGAQRDQVHAIEADVPMDDAVLFALTDADAHRSGGSARLEHPWGVVHCNGMIRVHDAIKSLEARGYAGDGGLTVALADLGTYRLEVDEGRARLRKAAGPHDLLFPDSASLAMVAFGGLAPSRAARAGLVQIRDTAAARLADSVLFLPPFHSREPF